MALLAMLLAIVAVWGWTFVVVKDAIADYGVLPFLAVRFTLAAVVLAPLALRGASRRGLGLGGAIGVVLAAAYMLQTYGLRHTTATNTGLLTGLFIIFTPLANRVLFGVRTSWAFWGGIAASLLGLGLVTGASAAGATRGDLLTLGCAAVFGLHLALLDRYAKGHPPITLAGGQVAAAAVLFLAVSLALHRPAWPTREVWWALAVTALVATAAGYFVQTLVQRTLTAVETASIIVLEPIFAVVFGYLLAGERLTALQIVGAAIMVGALATVQLLAARNGRGRKAPTASTREHG